MDYDLNYEIVQGVKGEPFFTDPRESQRSSLELRSELRDLAFARSESVTESMRHFIY